MPRSKGPPAQHKKGPGVGSLEAGPIKEANPTNPNQNNTMELTDVQQSLKPVLTRKKDKEAAAAAAGPALPDSPYQPTSRTHVAELASTIIRQGSSTIDKAAAAVPVLPDSPYQPTSKSHVASMASSITSCRGGSSSSSSYAHTPHHTPVLADSGDFQPNSKSHVAQLANQVASRLNGQNHSSSSPHHTAEDCPYQPESHSHVSDLVKTYKKMLAADGSRTLNKSRSPGPGCTPHNTPLAAHANSVVTPFTQQQQQQQGSTPTHSSSSNSSSPEIIHLSCGKQAPFKGKSSQVSKLVQKFATAADTDNGETAAGNEHMDGQQQAEGSEGSTISRARSLPAAATPPSSNDGISHKALAPRDKPHVVAARASSSTLAGAKAVLERSAAGMVPPAQRPAVQERPAVLEHSGSAEVKNPLYRPSADGEGVDLVASVSRLSGVSHPEQVAAEVGATLSAKVGEAAFEFPSLPKKEGQRRPAVLDKQVARAEAVEEKQGVQAGPAAQLSGHVKKGKRRSRVSAASGVQPVGGGGQPQQSLALEARANCLPVGE